MKLEEILVTPKDPSSTECRNNARKRKRKISTKYLEARKQRRQLPQISHREQLQNRPDQRKEFTINITIKKIIEAYKNKLIKQERNIIAIDIEKITLKTKNNYSPDRALWVTVINNNEKIKLNQIIRWPIKSVAKMGTEFYGITKDDMKYRDSLNFIRYQVLELCNKADAILTTGPEETFDSLCYLTTDYNSIRRKVIDLERLLSPRKDGNPIALNYLNHMLLQT